MQMEMYCDSQGHLGYKSHVGMHQGVCRCYAGDDSPPSEAHFNAGTELIDIEETRSVEYRY